MVREEEITVYDVDRHLKDYRKLMCKFESKEMRTFDTTFGKNGSSSSQETWKEMRSANKKMKRNVTDKKSNFITSREQKDIYFKS